MHRVAITGRGVVSSIGNDLSSFTNALCNGGSGIGRLSEIGIDNLDLKIGAFVRGFDPLAHFRQSELTLLDRTTQLGLVSARQALAESGLSFGGALANRTGVVIGTGAGNMNTIEDSYRSFIERNRRPHPLSVPKLMLNAVASHISLENGIKGPSFVVATACASSAYAIALGYQMIRSGAMDAMVVGGAEACMTEGSIRTWEALRVLAPDACRPFSKGRLGLVLGEGAAMLVLESYEHALARGAVIYGELLSCAMNTDAHHITNPHIETQAEAMRSCLADACLQPSDVSYINAHGTGTAANDLTETRSIQQAFGAHAEQLLVSSTKSMHGHVLGGSGAIEALATLVALNTGMAPPTINFTEPDPDCNLNYVPNHAQPLKGNIGLSNSFAFGGHNAVLAFRGSHAG